VVFEDLHGLIGGLLAVIDVLLVVGVATGQRAEPATQTEKDLGVGERDPAEDGGVVLLGLAEEGRLLVLGRDFCVVSML